jgi:hypothetical protein
MLIFNAPHALDQQAVAPPWLFAPQKRCIDRMIGGDAPLKFGAGPNCRHYPTIVSIAQFLALPLGELAHPDSCRLFIWITIKGLRGHTTAPRREHSGKSGCVHDKAVRLFAGDMP